MNATEQRLLNDYQRNFPLTGEPFQRIANQLGADAGQILNRLARLLESGVISRIGPVFRPNTIGASTLAAMSVPASELLDVAARISAYPEVNHNYEREHAFNLWFVVNTVSASRRDAVLRRIEWETGHGVMSLPLVRDYHINLGFDLDFSDPGRRIHKSHPDECLANAPAEAALGRDDFVPVLQEGLPLVDRPFAALGARCGMTEDAVLNHIRGMLRTGAMKRFGVVVRHHELGYRANAMCVWDVPDDEVDAVGKALGRRPEVTLCYRRPRNPPAWPYNLFCMIHGKHRERVRAEIQRLATEHRLDHLPRAVLFSGRRFKQRGAYYGVQSRSSVRVAAHG